MSGCHYDKNLSAEPLVLFVVARFKRDRLLCYQYVVGLVSCVGVFLGGILNRQTMTPKWGRNFRYIVYG